MNVLIHNRNLKLTDRLQNYVEKKTAKLDRYMPGLTEVRVDLSEQNARNSAERQVAQITIKDGHGAILRAEEHHEDIFAAVDAVIDKLYRQIKRYRGKQRKHRRQANNEEILYSEPLPVDDELDELDENTIVRRKAFPIMPMTAVEAIDQMDLLGHDFYVFFNADENAVNVVYKRHDQNYGLLLPELA